MLTRHRSPSRLLLIVGLAVLYVIAGKVSLYVAYVNPSASPVWAPSGIALAGLLLLGRRAWPAIFLGAFAVNETTTGSVATSLAIAAGNTLEAVVGAYLVARFARGRRAFERVPDIFKFALLSAVFSTTLSATIGVTSLGLGGYADWSAYWSIWWTWWLGDVAGDLIVAPFIILWAERSAFSELRSRGVEAGLCLLSTVAIGVGVFGGVLRSPSTRAQLVFLCIPFLVWASLRLGRQVVATAILMLSAVAIGTTLLRLGPFAGAVTNASLLWLQSYMAVMVVTMLPAAAVVRDRTRVAAALRLSEERYRLLAESIPQIVFSLTADGRAHFTNQRWFAYTGMKPVESLDFGWLSAVHPDDREASLARWQRSLAEGEPFETEFRLRRADGSYRWHLGRSLPWRGPEDRIARWIGTCTDIDDVKRLEADRARLLSREQATRIDAEATVSMLRRLEMVTDTALSGLTLEAMIEALIERLRIALGSDTVTVLLLDADGQHLVPAISQGLTEEVEEALRVPLGSGVSGRIAASAGGLIIHDLADVNVVSPVLKERVRSLAGVPLKIDGRLVGVIHVGTVRPRVFTSDDLRLLELVAHRTARAIERARLYEAERAARADAESASRAKDEFLAMLSHELQTPLNVVLLWATLLRSGGLDPPATARALETIEEHARAQNRMIVDLLDVNRIVAGKLTLGLQPVDLADVMDRSIESLRPTAEAKGVSVTAELDRAIGLVVCDPHRVQQIVWNLLSNAVKFTPEGGRVEVALAQDGDHVNITVSDSGQGISRDFLLHVFERFRQAESGLTRAHGGLGLGLAIVRHLVDLHCGAVRAASDGEGKGATFTVRLPRSLTVTPSALP